MRQSRPLLLIALLLPSLVLNITAANAANTLSAEVAQLVETNSQTWRSGQPDDDYVIQLVSVRDTKNLPTASDIRAIKQVDPSRDVVYHPKRVNGVTWHTLVWGAFDSKAEGQAMFNKLPTRWQKMQPWVRPMNSIEGAAPAVAAPVVVVEATPVRRPAPQPTARVQSKKHPVSPIDRSQFPSQPPVMEDSFENYGEDFSNHESAIAAQGTYPYIKLSAGQVEQDTDALVSAASAAGTVLPGIKDSFTDSSYEIAVGLDVGYYLGFELGYIDASALESKITLPAAAAAFKEKAPFGFKGFKGSLLVKLPIDARRQWQPFVQVGAIQWTSDVPGIAGAADTENKSTDLFYAAGLDYKFNKKWALGVKYSHYDMDAEARAITADLTWRWEGRQ